MTSKFYYDVGNETFLFDITLEIYSLGFTELFCLTNLVHVCEETPNLLIMQWILKTSMSRIFREKPSKLSNLANLVYADVSKKEAGKTARIIKRITQTSQKHFILVTQSKSLDYRTTIEVIEYNYHERLIDSWESLSKIIFEDL